MSRAISIGALIACAALAACVTTGEHQFSGVNAKGVQVTCRETVRGIAIGSACGQAKRPDGGVPASGSPAARP